MLNVWSALGDALVPLLFDLPALLTIVTLSSLKVPATVFKSTTISLAD
jgi:hypothetical protein